MAVVINEFDVVPAGAKPERSGEPEKSGGEKSSPPSEREIERLVEHQNSRCERVWAH